MKKQRPPISIVVADHHPVVLRGLTSILRSNSDMEVLAACDRGEAALEAIRKWRPNLTVLDIAMPGLSGLDLLNSISANGLETEVVVFTAAALVAQDMAAIANKAKGVVFKKSAIEDLIRCIRTVAAGGTWFPSDLIEAALKRETGCPPASIRIAQSLTPREQEVALIVAEGLSNKGIARRLFLSEGTVKIHLNNIYQKTGLKNRTALAALAITHQLSLPVAS